MLMLCAIVWGILYVAVFVYCRRVRTGSVGIPLAYATLLSIAHCGALVYLVPWYNPALDPMLAAAGVNVLEVTSGFVVSTVGMAGLCLGLWLFDRWSDVRPVRQSFVSGLPRSRCRPAVSSVLSAAAAVIPSPSMTKAQGGGADVANVGPRLSAAATKVIPSPSRGEGQGGGDVASQAVASSTVLPHRGATRMSAAPPMTSRAGRRQGGDGRRRGRNLILGGIVLYFLLSRLAPWISGAGSITSIGASLSVVGMCLLASSIRRQPAGSRFRLFLIAAAFPILTTAVMGFVGFGVAAFIQFGSFLARGLRLRWWHACAGPVVLWFGLSFYVAYLTNRVEMRKTVWGGAGILQRVEVAIRPFLKPQPFDPWNQKHLHAIDIRMNQNALVGRAIHYMEREKKEFTYGKSLGIAAVAWIPRALWPGKPAFGGSMGLVSEFTGITFTAATSVGIGNVLEFYVNFGQWGVFAGFVIFGAFLRFLDRSAALALQGGNTWDYVFFHLVGISALQPGGMFAEVIGSCAAAALLVTIVRRLGIRP